MKKKIGANEYEVVCAAVVKPNGQMVMSDGKRASCGVRLTGPVAKNGDEYAVVDGAYIPVSVVEKREAEAATKGKADNSDAPPVTDAALKKAAAAAKRKEKAAVKEAAKQK